MSIRLKTAKADEKLPIGTSKIFGNPDAWDSFEWPAIEQDGELYDLTFMCQINCADAAQFDADGLLPKTGMLYFFYDLDEMPWSPDNKSAAKVLYYGGDLSKLHEMLLTDENGESIAFCEQKIEFETVAEGYLSDSEPTHLLLGIPSLDYGTEYAYIKNWQMLLQLDSFETEDAVVNFTDEGVLCFYIEPDKLKSLDFYDVRIMQIYS